MPIERKETIIIDILRYLFSRKMRISDKELIKKIAERATHYISKTEANNIINMMRSCDFIHQHGENGKQMISIEPKGIAFLLDNEYKKKQIEIVDKQIKLAETQTKILNKMNIIYWVIAIATIMMALATILLAIRS